MSHSTFSARIRAIITLLVLISSFPAYAEVKAPRGEMAGIWDIVDEGHNKYDELSLSISHQHIGIGYRSADKPLFATGLVRKPGSKTLSEASARPYVGDDGTVTMKFGQFEYNGQSSVEYSVKPTADPDTLVGTWSYDGKSLRNASGKSVWRRRPPIHIDSIYFETPSPEAEGQYIRHSAKPGEGILEIPQARTRGNLTITILGDRMAGGHNLLIDVPGETFKTRDRGWLCENGAHHDYGDEWRKCGSTKTLGDGVIGLRFMIRSQKAWALGSHTIWLDGQPMGIRIISAEEAARKETLRRNKPELVFLNSYKRPRDKAEFAYGDTFFLRVKYLRAPDSPPTQVTLEWQGKSASVDVFPEKDKDTEFTSKGLVFEYGEPAVFRQEGESP